MKWWFDVGVGRAGKKWRKELRDTRLRNKCVSKRARRKSHHTALVDAAAPSSECPPSVARNCESCNEPRKCARQPAPQQQPLAASNYASRVGLRSAKRVFLSVMTLTFDLWPPKWQKTCPDSRPKGKQNFTPLPFSAAEKSVTVQTKILDTVN